MAGLTSFSFPRFSNGDVDIKLTEEGDRYTLHSQTLCTHSAWFATSLSPRWSRENTEVSPGSTHRKFTYELRFDRDSELGMLVHQDSSDVKNKDLLSGNALPTGTPQAQVTLHTNRLRVLKAHQDLLGMLYYRTPHLDREKFDNAKAAILDIVEVAAAYGCEHVASLHIENHLWLHFEEILDRCERNALVMLEFAMQTKSSWIFKEAAAYMVGADGDVYNSAKEKLGQMKLLDLMTAKRGEFVEMLRDSELAIFKLDWSEETTRHEILAHALFRKWLASDLNTGGGSGLAPAYAWIYHRIAEGDVEKDETGWVEDDIEEIFGRRSDKDVLAVKDQLRRLCDVATDLLQPILDDVTRGRRNEGCGNLTFIGFEDGELPWK